VRVQKWFAATIPVAAYYLLIVSLGGLRFTEEIWRREPTPSDGGVRVYPCRPAHTVSYRAPREHARDLGLAIVAILDDCEVAEVLLLSGEDLDAALARLAGDAVHKHALRARGEGLARVAGDPAGGARCARRGAVREKG